MAAEHRTLPCQDFSTEDCLPVRIIISVRKEPARQRAGEQQGIKRSARDPAPGRTAEVRRLAAAVPAPPSGRCVGHTPPRRTTRVAAFPVQSSAGHSRRHGKARTAPPATGPKIASSAAPIGCRMVARRAEIIGDARRSRVNSISRAATCAGPTSAPAATAAVGVAPMASSSRGKCAASAVETNQVAPNTRTPGSPASKAPQRT